jgi:hypothetical protein
MLCDVCNQNVPEGGEAKVTAKMFSFLLDKGFGIDESNIQMLIDGGMSRRDAVIALKEQYRAYSSDWLLCTQCAVKAEAKLAEK